MKDILIFLAVMALSLIPSLLKSLKEGDVKNARKPAPKVKPDPYFPDADQAPKRRYATTRPTVQGGGKDDYFTYETVEDTQPRGAAPNKESQKAPTPEASAPRVEIKQEGKSKIELSLEEEEIYKGIIYSEILKRKYI
ncbi:MAG: hypothetical protein J6T86_03670 [Bacteroidales bacterium]|nr:hypothetical protein [Bacteroidales bacterium]